MVQELIRHETAATPTPTDVNELKENYQLLVSFLVYLIENYDHDGFSLVQISQILDLPSDKPLAKMVATLRQSRKRSANKSA